MANTRALIYCRRSKESDASASVSQQAQEAADYAERQGWVVAGTYIDEDVSATKKAPSDRPGWRALMAEARAGDVIVVRHQDRLVRSVLDWSGVVHALQAKQFWLATVEGDIDITTAQGELVGNILASVGQMEARMMSERIKGSRRQAYREGRSVGGVQPYGWRLAPNPDGVGVVVEQDPDRIDWVRGMVERCQADMPTYAIVAWLNQAGAPLPTDRDGDWTYSTVARLLRNPILAGLTAHNPGYVAEQGERGPDVLRDEAGEPAVDADLAVMSVQDWRRMVAALDARTGGAHTPVASRRKTSPLLAGLVWCADCDRPMNRGRTAGREGYKCPGCYQTITRIQDIVVDKFLELRSHHLRLRPIEAVHADGGVVLELDRRIAELGQALAEATDEDDEDRLLAEMQAAKQRRRERRAEAADTPVAYHSEEVGPFGDDWRAASGDVDAQRAVLADAIDRIEVRRGGVGRRYPHHVEGRVRIHWRTLGGYLEPPGVDDQDWYEGRVAPLPPVLDL